MLSGLAFVGRNCRSFLPCADVKRFAGHSKFHNIKYRKGRQDTNRMRLFDKLARAIASAVNEGV
jgi:hypothetical protein